MSFERKIILGSFTLGLVLWIIDAAIDYAVFYRGSFLDLLILAVPGHEVYVRLLVLVSFLLFGVVVARLVSARIRAEESLRESEEKYWRLIETSPYCITIHQDEKVVFSNQAMAQLLGVETPQQLMGRSIFDAIPPDRMDALRDRIRRLMAGETGLYPVEDVYYRQDGSTVPVEVTVIPFTYRGRPANQAIVLDITDRKRAEVLLQESEERYRLLVETSPYAIGIHQDGKLVFANEAAVKLLGANDTGQLVGMPIEKIIHPDTRSQSIARMQGMLAGQTDLYPAEDRYVRLDGTVAPVEVTVAPFLFKGQSAFQVIAMDITDQKQAEESLRRSEQKFRSYVDHAPDGIFVANEQGQYIDVNPAACRITGYPKEELVGKGIIDMIPPEEQAKAIKHFETVVKTGSVAGDTPIEFLRKDGSRGYWTVDGVRLSDTRFLGFVKDVTDRKKLEQQLRQAQRMEAIGHLAGGIAHDFNNLLTVINGYSELVLNRLSRNDYGFNELQQIQQAGERAQSLTRQLLAFSRKQILQPQVLNLNQLLAEMEKMLRRLIGEDIGLVSVYSPDLRFIMADPSQLEQVVLNLAVNARDAMPAGGKLTLETKNVYLDETYAQNHADAEVGMHVMLAISDNGQGMDRETLVRIFDPFFTTKEVGKGTGLGLATVYGIVKQSGGSIYVYSEPGQGTTFKIYFRAIESTESSEAAQSTQAEMMQQGTETVLVVEDEEAVRELVSIVLEKYGYTVLQALDSEEALSLLQQKPVDLLLTDVVMPGLSGRFLADQALSLQPDIEILYMSGYTDNAIVHHGVLDEGTNFIQKPFSPQALLQTIRQVLDNGVRSS